MKKGQRKLCYKTESYHKILQQFRAEVDGHKRNVANLSKALDEKTSGDEVYQIFKTNTVEQAQKDVKVLEKKLQAKDDEIQAYIEEIAVSFF